MITLAYKVKYNAAKSAYLVSSPTGSRFPVAKNFTLDSSEQLEAIARDSLKLKNFAISRFKDDYFITPLNN